jgi:hypothetical protein
MRRNGDIGEINFRERGVIFGERREIEVKFTVNKTEFEQVRRVFEKSFLFGRHRGEIALTKRAIGVRATKNIK